MPITDKNNTPRETILAQLSACDSLERGTLVAEYRDVPSPDGSGSVRRGPYFKHQCWEDGKNRSARVPAEQVARLREDIENGHRFDVLTAQLAQAAVEKSRSERAALSAPPATKAADDAADDAVKKNSTQRASRNDIAKPKPSLPPSAKRSRRKV